MAYFAYGQMWHAIGNASQVFVTTNATVKNNGELVMGRGAAEQLTKLIPGIAARFGQQVKQHREEHEDAPYGILVDHKTKKFGAFQVKDHWAHMAKLDLIEYSTDMLRDYALTYEDRTIFLNMPGIGFGRLSEDDVLPILERLPDNVVLWANRPLRRVDFSRVVRYT